MKRKLYLLFLLAGLICLMFVERFSDFEKLIGWQYSSNGDAPSFIAKSLFYFITYSLNALGSIAFLHFLFQDKSISRGAVYLYLFGLLVWIPLFVLFVQFWHLPGFEFFAHGYQFIRRPIFLFVLIAVFTFLKKKEMI